MMTTFYVEHVVTGKREAVTEEQWKQMNKLFPGTFRRVKTTFDSLSDDAKKIIAESDSNE